MIMEGHISDAACTLSDSPETENACSICMDIYNNRRPSLKRWMESAGGYKEVPNVSQGQIESLFHTEFQHRDASPSDVETGDPETGKPLCAFCTHLRLENLVWLPGSDFDKIVSLAPNTSTRPRYPDLGVKITMRMDRIPDILSRRDICLLCSLISKLVLRKGVSDLNQDIFLQLSTEHKLWVFIEDKSGDEEPLEIGSLSFTSLSSDDDNERHALEQHEPLPDLTMEASVPEKIDWPAATKWIEDSLEEDGLDCNHHEYPADFRLIDVEHLCVVRAQTPCEYACLSYVWGVDESCQATLDTIRRLEQPNSLGTWDNLEQPSTIGNSNVPAAIKDAMVACSALGKRYLWVDRLCIVQDEGEETNPSKRELISAMGDIYRRAFVTMVAMEGTSAACGLHGVSLERMPCYRVCIGGEYFSKATEDFDHVLRDAVWNTRGWTYQEAVLSPRLLFFTKHGLWYEDTRLRSDIQWWALLNAIEPRFHTAGRYRTWDYASAVKKLTERQFGYEWDILPGFSGILNHLFGKDHRFGLPLEGFDDALLWSLGGLPERRQSQGSSAFPSWSWISVNDPAGSCVSIKESYGLDLDIPIVSVASWVFLDGDDVGQVPWPREEGQDDDEYVDEDEEWDADDFVAVATILWRNGCMIEPFPENLLFKGQIREYAKVFKATWPTRRKLFDGCRGFGPDGQGRSRLLDKFDAGQIAVGRKHSGVVLGYSQATVLTLANESSDDCHSHGLFYEDEEVGWLAFQSRDEYSDTLERLDSGLAEVEVFALSASLKGYKSCIWSNSAEMDLDRDTLETHLSAAANYKHRSGRPMPTVIDMNVMGIRTTDGVSRRVGIGRISLHTWLKLEKSFKPIVLQ